MDWMEILKYIMIDSLCDMSKVINPATPADKVTAKKEEGK